MVTLRTMMRSAEVPGCTRSWTRRLKSSLMPRFPASPIAAPMIPPATPTSGASGNRNSSPISTPQNSPLRLPQATAWCAGVTPDNGRIRQVDHQVVFQFHELVVDALGRVLVRVTDNDQVAHRGSFLRDGVVAGRRRPGSW